MAVCRILLTPLAEKDRDAGYSAHGLKHLSGSTKMNPQLPFTRSQFVQELPAVQKGMSISGYQPKLQMVLEDNVFQVVDHQGEYILKPSPAEFPGLAENEHATMTLMSRLGFAVPAHGLVRFAEENAGDAPEYAFAIRRFDRDETGSPLHQEQLDGAMGIYEKYGKTGDDGKQYVSYEQIARFLTQNVNDNLAFKIDIFRRILYAYLLGNNDMHLRNFGLIHPRGALPYLSPVYDFVSVTPYPDAFASGYLALPLLACEEGEADLAPGFKTRYGEYLGGDFLLFGESLGLAKKLILRLFNQIEKDSALVESTYMNAFMSSESVKAVLACFRQRLNRLHIINEPPL